MANLSGIVDQLSKEPAGAGKITELRTSYELAYYPTNPANDGTFRKIVIRPKGSGVTVRSRTGYFSRPAD
jgi:hypothetical protein